jgi:hypothetical protein
MEKVLRLATEDAALNDLGFGLGAVKGYGQDFHEDAEAADKEDRADADQGGPALGLPLR